MSVDYSLPSPHEIKSLARPRYNRTGARGRLSRAWGPSKYRIKAVRLIVYVRDAFRCQECGSGPEKPPTDYAGEAIHELTLDHVIPYRDGGLFYPGNLTTLCGPCNSRKGARGA